MIKLISRIHNKLGLPNAGINNRLLFFSALLLVFLIAIIGSPLITTQANPTYKSDLTATLDSLAANGAAATLLTFREFDDTTNTGVSGQTVDFNVTGGELNVLSPKDGQKPNDGPNISVITDADGYAVVQLRSATIGTKLVTASVEGDSSLTQTLSIKFTSELYGTLPPPIHISNPLPAPTAGTSTSPNTSGSSPTFETPATPALTSIKIAGETIQASEKVSVKAGVPIEIIGMTIPNGNITLYIYSSSATAKVVADDKGLWTYTVRGLSPGSHHIDAEVTDPASNKTSARKSILSFTISPDIASHLKSSFWSRWYRLIIALAALLVASLIILGYTISKSKKNKKEPSNKKPRST